MEVFDMTCDGREIEQVWKYWMRIVKGKKIDNNGRMSNVLQAF